jgi:hypothetical protein
MSVLTWHGAELRGCARQMRDPCAPNLVLAGQAGDVGAGAADPPALDHGSAPPRLRHVPSQQLAALSAPKDQDFKLFRLRHGPAPLVVKVLIPSFRKICGSLLHSRTRRLKLGHSCGRLTEIAPTAGALI